jgi:phosphoglycolate phosphatase
MSELGAQADETWMVGDSATDVLTARAAGARVAGVTWGFHPEGLRAAGPDRLFDLPADLADLAA